MKENPIVELPKPNERVRLHPASDWFMRGERYAGVLRVENSQRIHVKGEQSRKKFMLRVEDIIEVLPHA